MTPPVAAAGMLIRRPPGEARAAVLDDTCGNLIMLYQLTAAPTAA